MKIVSTLSRFYPKNVCSNRQVKDEVAHISVEELGLGLTIFYATSVAHLSTLPHKDQTTVFPWPRPE